jgi:hypothetical protein
MKYKKFPMPIEAWKNFKIKQKKMQDTIFQATGRRKNIPLTRIIIATSKKPIFFENDEIRKIAKRGVRI